MAISVDERMPLTLQQAQTSKDSLKLADMQKTFSIISEVPSTDIVSTDNNQNYDTQTNEILDTLKALQVAKKSLSDVQSITKDIKSNYKTEKNDAWAPIDDTMLKQRYEAVQQIKNILNNATFNHKNVFTMDYSKNGVKLDLERKDINSLNLRDEHSINIFSDNISRLSQQIEGNIQKLQDKVDNMNKGRWLSMENLRNVRLQQKEVNTGLQANTTPSLASALAQVAQQQNVQQEATKNSPTIATQEPMQDNKEATRLSLDDNKVTESNLDSKGNETQNPINNKDAEAVSKTTNKENIPQTDAQNTTKDIKGEAKQEENTNINKQEQDSTANNKDSKAEEPKETSTNQTQQKSTEEANKETSTDANDHSINKQEDNANANNKIEDSKETLANANSNVSQTTNENSNEKEVDSKLDSKMDSKAASETDSKADSKENTTQESTQATAQTNVNNDTENATKGNTTEQNSTQVSESTNSEKQNDTQNKVASTETNINSTADKENENKEQVIDLFV